MDVREQTAGHDPDREGVDDVHPGVMHHVQGCRIRINLTHAPPLAERRKGHNIISLCVSTPVWRRVAFWVSEYPLSQLVAWATDTCCLLGTGVPGAAYALDLCFALVQSLACKRVRCAAPDVATCPCHSLYTERQRTGRTYHHESIENQNWHERGKSARLHALCRLT